MSFIPLIIPNIQETDINAVSEVLRSKMLVQGKKVLEFEKYIAEYIGVKEAIAVSNGTASLHLCLIALGIGAGDEVIIPAFSYVATANVVKLVGAKPIFVDIDIDTFNINDSNIVKAITKKTKAIIPVHEFGLACNMVNIKNIAEKYNLKIIEDAACALGAEENNIMVGSLGQMGSFSFHPRKAITSGEGGIITTNDSELAERVRILRNHGIHNTEFVAAGFNYRMTDFQAALLTSQFKRFESNLSRREEIAKIYSKNIDPNKYILPKNPTNKRHTWQTFHAIIEFENRDQLIQNLFDQGIQTNYGAQCIPDVTYYKDKYKFNSELSFPNAYKAYKNGIAIPIYELLTNDQVHFIIEKLNLASINS